MSETVQIINLKDVKAGQLVDTSVGLLVEKKIITYGAGKKFLVGVISDGSNTISFKMWDEARAVEIGESNIEGKIIAVNGKTEEYKGNTELVVQDLIYMDQMQTAENLKLFKPVIDGKEEKYKEFLELVNKELSQKALKVMVSVVNKERLALFQEEMAGTKMHDAKIGGLLNHTLKMLKYALLMIENDPRISAEEDLKDLILLGVILHDIGKIQEYSSGTRTENSFVTHRVFGVEYLRESKDVIIEQYNEKFYYELVDVIVGHHGEWGNPPTTVVAYIVHLIDMLDSKMTGVMDAIERGETQQQNGNRVVYMNGSRMVI